MLCNHELCGSLYSYILIKLSPYQHLCCIVSLIASFCSIKSPIFAGFYPYFSMLFSVFDLSVICTPNGKTAETRILQTRSESKRENGWEVVFRLLGNDQLSQSGCWKYNGNCILKSCFPRKNKITLPSREGSKMSLLLL